MSMRWFDVCFSDFRLEKTLLRSLSLSLAEAVLLGCVLVADEPACWFEAGAFFCAAF